jgi:folate-binding protein YgfZ
MPSAFLSDRAVLSLHGQETEDFLNRLLTQTVPEAGESRAAYAALLTPQGKVISDMMILRDPGSDDGFLIDCPKAVAADLIKKFTLYRLRAKVEIADRSDQWGVTVSWDGDHPDAAYASFADPRLATLGWRSITPVGVSDEAATQAYHAHRIGLAIPEGGKDYTLGSVFPHEVNLDQLHGLAFDKGCYVGQEVVSRMEHRALARTRLIAVTFPDGITAPEGTEVLAGRLIAGHLGSVTQGGKGLALLRLDRISDALAKGEAITAGGLPLIPLKPDWARFDASFTDQPKA